MPVKRKKSTRSAGGLPKRRNDHRVSLATAIDYTKRYRKSAPGAAHGGFFWADAILALLNQPGVVGMRFYHGLDAKCQYQLVLVGVDARGRDIVKRTVRGAAARGDTDAVIIDTHWPCPPFCPDSSPLG